MLGLVVAVGAGVLFGMRHIGMGGLIEMTDIKIDYPIDQAQSSVTNACRNGLTRLERAWKP